MVIKALLKIVEKKNIWIGGFTFPLIMFYGEKKQKKSVDHKEKNTIYMAEVLSCCGAALLSLVLEALNQMKDCNRRMLKHIKGFIQQIHFSV